LAERRSTVKAESVDPSIDHFREAAKDCLSQDSASEATLSADMQAGDDWRRHRVDCA